MKYKRIPFNVKYRPQLESGQYKLVCYSVGYIPTIISWEDKRFPDFPLLVDIRCANSDTHKEFPYTVNGSQYVDGSSCTDLFIITDKPELTEAELYLKSLIECYATNPGNKYELPEEKVKDIANKLRELFKKEEI
jgi:hypothetical protein